MRFESALGSHYFMKKIYAIWQTGSSAPADQARQVAEWSRATLAAGKMPRLLYREADKHRHRGKLFVCR